MKTEAKAWQKLREEAAAQLRSNFADTVLRGANGPAPALWTRLFERGAGHLRPGFAERVLRAARILPRTPSLLDQLALGAATAAFCLLSALAIHARTTHLENERNLAGWHQLAAEVQDIEEI